MGEGEGEGEGSKHTIVAGLDPGRANLAGQPGGPTWRANLKCNPTG